MKTVNWDSGVTNERYLMKQCIKNIDSQRHLEYFVRKKMKDQVREVEQDDRTNFELFKSKFEKRVASWNRNEVRKIDYAY